jgi:hypothetical protein
MKKRLMIWTLFASMAGPSRADVYIIYYATYNGKTGHVGIAVDNYKILIRETRDNGVVSIWEDTVATGELSYFDLWPLEDSFNLYSTSRDQPAVYYRLPVSSTEEITLNSLYDKGIPHREYYPCDGILRVATEWREDDRLRHTIDSIIRENRPFNARSYNCADFVIGALESILEKKIVAKEFVVVGMSSTPNALYRELRKVDEISVIKNADDKSGGSFLRERILGRTHQ